MPSLLSLAARCSAARTLAQRPLVSGFRKLPMTAVSIGRRSLATTAPPSKPPHPSEGFLQGSASTYVEEMFEAWRHDPSSVHVSWQAYFRNVSSGAQPGAAVQAPPTLVPVQHYVTPDGLAGVSSVSSAEILDHLKVQLIVRAYQVRGHQLAKLDPLNILQPDAEVASAPELDYTFYGFTEKDLDRTFHIGTGMLPGFLSADKKTLTLREIIASLKNIYCVF
jgi:2-oxoglutarate dehydrogenase E1 component